jgi:hypothetical protein
VTIRSLVLRHKVEATLVGALTVASVGVGLTSSLAVSAQPAPSGPDLARQYLAALTPAAAAIDGAEAKLAKLPVTATVAQVKAIVAPLGAPVAKLQALDVATTSPAAPSAARSLESLGSPAIVGSARSCNGYATIGSGAILQVGYTVYHDGFQISKAGLTTPGRPLRGTPCSRQMSVLATTMPSLVPPSGSLATAAALSSSQLAGPGQWRSWLSQRPELSPLQLTFLGTRR